MASFENKKIAIVYGDIQSDAPPDEQDVLIEADAVLQALLSLGYECVKHHFTFDVKKILLP